LVLNACTVDLDGKRLPRSEVDLVRVHVFDRLDPSAGHTGQRQGCGGGDRVVVRRFENHRVGHDDQLANGREAERRDEAELARAERGIGGGRELELDRGDAGLEVFWWRAGDDFGREAGTIE